MRGRYLEEFPVGETLLTAGRTITEADIVNFAGISGDFAPIHLDEEYSRASFYGRRVAHGLLVLAIASGLRVQLGLYEETIIAFLGIDQWEFVAPVFIGDTIHARLTTVGARRTSKPGRGILSQRVEVFNQRSELVQRGSTAVMIRARDSQDAS